MKKKKREGKQEGSKTTQSKASFGEVWKVALSFSDCGTELLSVSAAAEGQQRRTEAVTRMPQEMQVKEHRWMEKTSQRWRQLQVEDRTEMKKEAKY